jgi:hypothetical protein
MGPWRVLACALVAPGILATTALAQELIITGTDGNDELDGSAAGQAWTPGARRACRSLRASPARPLRDRRCLSF